jgi:hypothetical protein
VAEGGRRVPAIDGASVGRGWRRPSCGSPVEYGVGPSSMEEAVVRVADRAGCRRAVVQAGRAGVGRQG